MRSDLHRLFGERRQRLADMRETRLGRAAVARFKEIDGVSLGLIVSLELFTTMIPMIIIGFNYFSGFAEDVSHRSRRSGHRHSQQTLEVRP